MYVVVDLWHPRLEKFIYLFGILCRFQYCTGHITTGSCKGRENQYIQFIRVLYCKLPTNGKQLPAFPLEAMTGIEPRPQRWDTRLEKTQLGRHHSNTSHLNKEYVFYVQFFNLSLTHLYYGLFKTKHIQLCDVNSKGRIFRATRLEIGWMQD